MSAGDQLISVFVNTVGTIFSALIGVLFSSFIGPFFDAVAGLVGLGSGA